MNTILIESPRMLYHTDIALVFQALDGRQNEFNWLLTGFEGHGVGKSWGVTLPDIFDGEPQLIRGEELSRIVETINIQFIWGCLSGFGPEVVLDPCNLEVEPWADGNPMFWKEGVSPQHPRATVEIVCFDSSLTLLLSKDRDLSRRFCAFFPECRDLDEENRARQQRDR
ncbi:MAG: hypothetical protein V4671_01355 [Armatimonadota bacterium]